MFKILSLVGGLLIGSATAIAQQIPPRPLTACANQVPYGFPTITGRDITNICRTAYALSHDNSARIARWVAYTLTAENSIGCEPRINAFMSDRSIPRGQRAELGDYSNSGYDMGHIANNADMSWNRTVARESFILSNVAPQLPNLNRGLWRQLETNVRSWAFNSGSSITIYSGSIYDNDSSHRIGVNQVIVPDAFYKILINNSTRESIAFIFPHQDRLRSLRAMQTTVADVEQATGMTFPVPDNKNRLNRLWATNHSLYNSARQRICN